MEFNMREFDFIKAARGETPDRTPIWIMRQAGRYLPQYQKIKSKYSFLEICRSPELIAEVMGVDMEIVTDEQRLRPEKSEVERLWADNDKARQLFGWAPSYGGREGLKRGLAETVEWFRNPDNASRYKAGIYNL